LLQKGLKYTFTATPWRYEGPAGWYFVSLPVTMSQKIRRLLQSEEEGWGRLKAIARINQTEWQTAIWYDTKQQTYLLPIKALVRKKENISIDTPVKVVVWV